MTQVTDAMVEAAQKAYNDAEYMYRPYTTPYDPYPFMRAALTAALEASPLPCGTLLQRAAQEAYRVCAETRHVTLGDKVAAAILAIPAIQCGIEEDSHG